MVKSSNTRSQSKRKTKKKKEQVSYHVRPENMTVEKWQVALRVQFARQNPFEVRKISTEEVYADYLVFNPGSKNTYKVALRSPDHLGDNFCNCYDFKVSRLGTCKHIEAVFLYISKKRLKSKLNTLEKRDYSSVYLDYRSGMKVKLRIGEEATEEMAMLSMEYFTDALELTNFGLSHFETFLARARALQPEFQCYDDALEYILEQRDLLRRTQAAAQLELDPARLKDLIRVQLFPYQLEGMFFAYKNGRVIIGDEMGLGKTVQAIAAAQLFQIEQGITKVLILCPTSLKYQWKSEIEKFTGDLATVVEGNAQVRQRLHQNTSTLFTIASYHSALFDHLAMDTAGYDLVILDEAQRIKNWRTKIAQAVRKINTRYAIVLSGTPIENNLDELYGITQFVDPFALGPRHAFFPRYQTVDQNGRVIGYENLHEIRQLLANRLIRRTKKQVLKQLPKRTDKNLIVPMTREQTQMHREFADEVARLVNKWKRQKFLDEKDRQQLLKSLNKMRMVCDSTYILDPQSNHQTKLDELHNILNEILEIEGEKVVIFSQWARMNDLVTKVLDELGVEYRYLHGGVPSKERGALYTDFNNIPSVRVFLSTDAGGVGLNLQTASWLINMDIPWNPGTLEQRIGRIYRLGQEKPVNILNLVAQGTIEHNMLGVIQFKKSMAAGVLDDGEDVIFMGTDKFKKFMASVEMITRETGQSLVSISPDDVEQPLGKAAADKQIDALAPNESGMQEIPMPDDLDIQVESPSNLQNEISKQQQMPSPETLVQNGMKFLSNLVQTLNDPKARTQLVQTIVHKDEKTGQNYVRLPVENEQAVEGVLNFLGGLMKALGSS